MGALALKGVWYDEIGWIANWMNENDRSSGRGGTGAVGGSKNLKAIVIKAEKKMPKAVNPDVWKPGSSRCAQALDGRKVSITSPRKGGLSVYGTNVLMNMMNAIGAMPTKNSQFTYFEDHELISGEHVKETILVADPTCHACPVACKKEVEIKEGPYAGLRMEKSRVRTGLGLWGQLRAGQGRSHRRVDRSLQRLGWMLSRWAMRSRCSWKPLNAGMSRVMRRRGATTRTMGNRPQGRLPRRHRRCAGRGTRARSQSVGGTLKSPTTVKGMAIPAYDPRGVKDMGLGYATCNRGACHLRAYTPVVGGLKQLGCTDQVVDPLEWKGKGKSRR